MKKGKFLISVFALALLGLNVSKADRPEESADLFDWGEARFKEYASEHMRRDQDNRILWGYTETNGPAHWAALDPAFHLCAEGTEQSPIDIVTTEAVRADLPDIKFFYQPTSVNLVNNGRTVELDYDPGSFMEFEGSLYELAQFHFHLHSEHTFEQGARFAMEMHLVHTRTDPNASAPVAVVTAFIREGEANPILEEMWQHLPREEAHLHLPLLLNIDEALPEDRRTYRYRGSFTTPPCTEGVQWLLLKQPIEMSRQQIESFRQVLEEACCAEPTALGPWWRHWRYFRQPLEDTPCCPINYRPTQPLQGRQVLFDTTQDEWPEEENRS